MLYRTEVRWLWRPFECSHAEETSLSILLFSSFGEPMHSLLFLPDRSDIQCGLLLLELQCFMSFRDALLHTFLSVTSDINRHLRPELLFTGYSLIFQIILCKRWRWLCKKTQVDSDARFDLQQDILTIFTCLNSLRCSHVIGWIDNYINNCLTGVVNKVPAKFIVYSSYPGGGHFIMYVWGIY